MALSDDQRAMLRLLAQREQGYGDLAALMGLSVDEVRAKVKEALDQLEADGETAPPLPAEPAASAPPPTPAPSEPAPAATAPPAQPSPAEPVPAKQPAAAAPAGPTAPRRPRPSLPSGNGPRAAIAAGVLAVVALVVVLLVSGGGSDGDSAESSGDDSPAAAVNTSNGKDVTQAVLDPVDGSDAQGVAVFGRVKDSLALQVEATGLEPTAAGDSYTIWLYESAEKMLPLASTTVDKTGRLGAQVEVPTEVLGYLANETFAQIDISKTTDATLKASLAKATQEKKAPIYTGTDVLRGEITGPIIGAAKK